MSQFLRFAVVGACATLCHFCVLMFLIEIAGLHEPATAAAIGAVFGIATSYIGNYAWTFRATKPHREFILRFVAGYVFTMGFHTFIIYILADLLMIHYAIAFVIATIISTAMNFAIAKFLVFQSAGFAVRQAAKGRSHHG